MMKEQSPVFTTWLLRFNVRLWLIIVFAGQIIFALYILLLYWRPAMQGNFEKWNTAMPHFYVPGDIRGNLVFGAHVALAAIITIAGPLQLIPAVRRYAPALHRVSGRIYIVTALIISLAGLYLTWVRGAVGGMVNAVVISLNALIIITCAIFTIRNAIKRAISRHRQWAVHLFLGVSGVWLFRVFLMLWLAIFQAPVGFDPDTFTGPFLNVLDVFVYLFPQVMVAFYFYSKRSAKPAVKLIFSVLLFVLSMGITVGTFAATMGMWLPRL